MINVSGIPGSPADLMVLYDADCGFCMSSVRWLRRRDRAGRLAFRPLQDAEASSEPWIRDLVAGHDLRAALHVIDRDGQVTEGGAAMMEVLDRLPRWRVVARLGGLRAARPLVEAAYRLTAGHRRGLARLVSTAGPACRMPPAGGGAAA